MSKIKEYRPTPFSTEDARKMIPNQFELTILAAKKARRLKREGVEMYRTEALREIANGDFNDKEVP